MYVFKRRLCSFVELVSFCGLGGGGGGGGVFWMLVKLVFVILSPEAAVPVRETSLAVCLRGREGRGRGVGGIFTF